MTNNPDGLSDARALLPCPFCGGEAKRFTIEEEDENFGGDVIACTGVCGASSHVEFGRKENLVSLWNTRTPPASTSTAIAAGAELQFYAVPFAFHEPADDNGAAYVRDANGQAVAMMMWPGHSMEDTDAAVSETYALGRTFAAAAPKAASEDGATGLLREAQFLLDRLEDHQNRMTSDKDANEWHGHVAPAIARFRSAINLPVAGETL